MHSSPERFGSPTFYERMYYGFGRELSSHILNLNVSDILKDLHVSIIRTRK